MRFKNTITVVISHLKKSAQNAVCSNPQEKYMGQLEINYRKKL